MPPSPATHAEHADPATGSALLVVDGLRTRISTTGGVVTAVDGVSLTVGRGETLGIVGESGSGKSVLGRTIMGLYTTQGPVTVDGEVLFAGKDIHAMDQRERRALWGAEIGMVFQDPMTALNPVKKVGAHLTETLRRHQKLGRTAAVDRAAELLDLVGIPDPRRRLAQYPHELSGGMRQRVVIAMALANEPALLIADEPTTALDVTVQRQILDLLDTLQSELGMAIILISHNLGVVAGRADRVAVMYAGRLAETAPTDAVFDDPWHPYTHALLGAIPRLEQDPHLRLAAIGGAPPDMVSAPPGCRFAPRCQYAKDDCTTVLPELEPVPDSAGHEFACHHPVGQGGN
ncbi:ABC transporter ATP-binding protein [Saccharomonospora sp. NPDC006951]